MSFKMTKAEKSWVMYDVGNSALVLLATSVIPIYFKSLADGPALVAWSYAETVASLLIALLMVSMFSCTAAGPGVRYYGFLW